VAWASVQSIPSDCNIKPMNVIEYKKNDTAHIKVVLSFDLNHLPSKNCPVRIIRINDITERQNNSIDTNFIGDGSST
jgi:hypothetical protein